MLPPNLKMHSRFKSPLYTRSHTSVSDEIIYVAVHNCLLGSH